LSNTAAGSDRCTVPLFTGGSVAAELVGPVHPFFSSTKKQCIFIRAIKNPTILNRYDSYLKNDKNGRVFSNFSKSYNNAIEYKNVSKEKFFFLEKVSLFYYLHIRIILLNLFTIDVFLSLLSHHVLQHIVLLNLYSKHEKIGFRNQ